MSSLYVHSIDDVSLSVPSVDDVSSLFVPSVGDMSTLLVHSVDDMSSLFVHSGNSSIKTRRCHPELHTHRDTSEW